MAMSPVVEVIEADVINVVWLFVAVGYFSWLLLNLSEGLKRKD